MANKKFTRNTVIVLIVIALIVGGIIGMQFSGENGNNITSIAETDLLKDLCQVEGDQFQGCNPTIQRMQEVGGITTYQLRCCDGEMTLIPSQMFCFGNTG